MGNIIVINLTDSSLQSAVTFGSITYSAANDIPSNAYHHHSGAIGTSYRIWENWYLPGYNTKFETTNLASYIAGVLIAVGGLVGLIPAIYELQWKDLKSDIEAIQQRLNDAAHTARALATATNRENFDYLAHIAATDALHANNNPATQLVSQTTMLNHTASLTILTNATAAAGAAAALVTHDAVLRDIKHAIGKLGTTGALAGIAVGGITAVTGIALVAGTPLADYASQLHGCSVDPGPLGKDQFLTFTGKSPLTMIAQKMADGSTSPVPAIKEYKAPEKAEPLAFAGKLTAEQFDLMRRQGKIYRIECQEDGYCDNIQFLVRQNLKWGGGKEKIVTHGGIALDISKIYKLQLLNSNSCLTAGGEDSDTNVYFRDDHYNQTQSCCYWQFIPTLEDGVEGKGGWILIDRLNARFLCWSGSAIRQYQSADLAKAGFEIGEDGWAKKGEVKDREGKVTEKRAWPKGMVWNFSSLNGSLQGSIEQPGQDRICVTAHNTSGSDQIDGISFTHQNALQKWSIKVVNDGSDFKIPMKVVGGVYFRDAPRWRLENDKFAGNESHYVRGFDLTTREGSRNEIPNLKLEYMAHIENFGDTAWVQNQTLGNQNNLINGFAIRLAGADAAKYRISYMAHLSDSGDTDFYSDGEYCGNLNEHVEGMLVHLEKL